MTNKKITKEDIIDNFYDEKKLNNLNESLDNYEELNLFKEKLGKTKNIMDMINDDKKINIDILGIISKAESIQNKQKEKKETFLFIATAFIILFCFSLITFTLGSNFFITVQLIIFVLLPFSLIPMAKLTLK